jgi:membrane protein YdbS with pleckstrin-like domain
MASKPSRAPRMAERGALCLLIGIAVLVGPYFLQSSGWHDMIAGAAVVGWFAVVLGIALIVVDLLQRARGKRS